MTMKVSKINKGMVKWECSKRSFFRELMKEKEKQMATKNGLRFYDEKVSGKYKYRIVMDYYHPYEEKWKQVTCGSNATTKKALDEAKKKLELKVAKILREVNKKKTNLTINEALELWFEFRKEAVSEGTHSEDRDSTRIFKQKYGKWRVSKIEKEHLKDFLMDLNIAPASRKNYRSKLNLFFQFCEEGGYLDETPTLRVRLPQHNKGTLEEKQKREDKFFTVNEMRQLLEAMEQKAHRSPRRDQRQNRLRKRMFIEFQFLLGDRISESLGLRYQDIDETHHLLYLRSQYDTRSSVRSPKLKTLKTKHSERTLRLKQRELEIILWFKEQNVRQSDFIFTQENGSLFCSMGINRYLKEFCEVLPHKLPSTFVSHALRHSNVMFKKELGIDEQVIGRDGGWADNQMISKVYGRHITPMLQRQADQRLENFTVKNSQNIHKKTEKIGD